jgi:hypothetical protein
MPSFELRQRVNRTAADVFDFVAVHAPENNSRWEDEVVEWTDVSPRPIRVGTTAVMKRLENGKRRDTHLLCTDYQQDRRIAWRHTDPGPFQFAIAFDTLPTGASSTDLVVNVDITLGGFLRLMGPLFKRQMAKRGGEMVARMKTLLEGEPRETTFPLKPAART